MPKWIQAVNKDGIAYKVHYAPQRTTTGNYTARVLISKEVLHRLNQFPVSVPKFVEFETELEAAGMGLKAGLNWIADHG